MIADRQATLAGLSNPSPRVRRGAIIALDQMDGGDPSREQVVSLLNTTDGPLHKAVFSVIIKHPDWGDTVAARLRQWATLTDLDETRRDGLHAGVIAFAADAAIQDLVTRALGQPESPLSNRLLLIDAMSRTPLKKLPPAWIAVLGQCLKHGNDQVVRQTIATVRAVGGGALDPILHELGRDPSRPADLRVAAWVAVAPRAAELGPDDFAFLRNQIRSDTAPLIRLAAAGALGKCSLNDSQLIALTSALAEAGPLELMPMLEAYEHSTNPSVAASLLGALAKAPGLQSLTGEALRRVLAGYPEAVRATAIPILKRLEVDRQTQEARLAELEPLLHSGNARRGKDVFFGRTAVCSTCHLVKADGGHIGPDLSKIASIRSGRDLLEAVVFPSASFVRGYEPFVIATQDGRQLTGTLGRETVDAIFLNTAEAVETRIPRDQIEDMQQGPRDHHAARTRCPVEPRRASRFAGVPAIAPMSTDRTSRSGIDLDSRELGRQGMRRVITSSAAG